jgi:hypothetical protein
MSKTSEWAPDEPARLLIEKRLLSTRVLEGQSKTTALDIIKTKMHVGPRQAYKILGYLLGEQYFVIEPERLRRLKL